MKHIKKFETLNSANGFVIPKPFVGSISESGQVINCNEEGKKIEVNDGQIDIIDAATLISFDMYSNSMSLLKTFQAEEGMTWERWCSSKYNNDELRHYIISGDYIVWDGNSERVKRMTGYTDPQYAWTDVFKTDEIINNAPYRHSTSG